MELRSTAMLGGPALMKSLGGPKCLGVPRIFGGTSDPPAYHGGGTDHRWEGDDDNVTKSNVFWDIFKQFSLILRKK